MNKAHLHIRDHVSRFAPFFLIALFALPALWLLLQDKAFCTHDGNLHFYRLVALRHAIDQGLVFSRWTPGLVYGYGFPFFNFREIGSYYLPEALYLLGLSVPAALNLVYAGGLLLSGWGTYLLARDIWQKELAGLVAASASFPFVPPWASLLVGGIAGLLLPLTVYLVEVRLRLDDLTAVVGMHAVPAVWGLLALGLFADGRSSVGWNGVGIGDYLGVSGQGVSGFFVVPGFQPGPNQLYAQLVGLGALILLMGVVWLAFRGLDRLRTLWPPAE